MPERNDILVTTSTPHSDILRLILFYKKRKNEMADYKTGTGKGSQEHSVVPECKVLKKQTKSYSYSWRMEKVNRESMERVTTAKTGILWAENKKGSIGL